MQKFMEVARTFFIILSVTLVMRIGQNATLTDWIVIVTITLVTTGVAVVLFSILGITDKDIDAM